MERWDSPDTYYCHIDGSERPPCGSVFMKEEFWDLDLDENATEAEIEVLVKEADKISDKMHDDWDAWEKDREVMPWGICDKWKEWKDRKNT